RRVGLTVAIAAALACANARSSRDPDAPVPPRVDAFAGGRHRGVCYAHAMRPDLGYGSPASAASLRALRGLGVDWVSLTPFGFERRETDTEIRWSGDRVGETDERLAAAAAQARALGMRV